MAGEPLVRLVVGPGAQGAPIGGVARVAPGVVAVIALRHSAVVGDDRTGTQMVLQEIPPRRGIVRFVVVGDPNDPDRGGDVPAPGFDAVFDFDLVESAGIDLHPAEPLAVNGFDDAVEVVVVVEAVGGVVGKYGQRLVEGRPPDGMIA